MNRKLAVILTIILCLGVIGGAAADEFLAKDQIIDRLGGASTTEELSQMKTRGLGDTDRSLKVTEDSRGIKVVPKHVVLRLLFQINSTELADAQSHQQLAQLGLALSSSEMAQTTVEIAGHTCDLGSDDYNRSLSQRRAEKVRSDLITFYHIDPSRLSAVGYGECYPHMPNSCEANRRMNRRVVVQRVE